VGRSSGEWKEERTYRRLDFEVSRVRRKIAKEGTYISALLQIWIFSGCDVAVERNLITLPFLPSRFEEVRDLEEG